MFTCFSCSRRVPSSRRELLLDVGHLVLDRGATLEALVVGEGAEVLGHRGEVAVVDRDLVAEPAQVVDVTSVLGIETPLARWRSPSGRSAPPPPPDDVVEVGHRGAVVEVHLQRHAAGDRALLALADPLAGPLRPSTPASREDDRVGGLTAIIRSITSA